jgi:hypothetical protein
VLVTRWHKKFARRLAGPRTPTKTERDEAYACFDTGDFKIDVQGVSREAETGVQRKVVTRFA